MLDYYTSGLPAINPLVGPMVSNGRHNLIGTAQGIRPLPDRNFTFAPERPAFSTLVTLAQLDYV